MTRNRRSHAGRQGRRPSNSTRLAALVFDVFFHPALTDAERARANRFMARHKADQSGVCKMLKRLLDRLNARTLASFGLRRFGPRRTSATKLAITFDDDDR
jgi:hypothetical protein